MFMNIRGMVARVESSVYIYQKVTLYGGRVPLPDGNNTWNL